MQATAIANQNGSYSPAIVWEENLYILQSEHRWNEKTAEDVAQSVVESLYSSINRMLTIYAFTKTTV